MPRCSTLRALVCGIELAVDGHKLAWSVDEYLHGLGELIDFLVAKERAAKKAGS